MTLQEFNTSGREEVQSLLKECCGSSKWVSMMTERLPFADINSLIKEASTIWYNFCAEEDWKEAFSSHPQIGDQNIKTSRGAQTILPSEEQASIKTASNRIINELAQFNKAYNEKFGYIFIVCATGKPAEDMLKILTDRIKNSPTEELKIAMGEQHKITILRLQKIITDTGWTAIKPSQVTTHVLDTSIGKPAKGVTIRLQQASGQTWHTISQGITNKDGRISDLLPTSIILHEGDYKMLFETKAYFESQELPGFYPVVEIQFTIFDESHYHIPLLINPFGYSTYRGS